MQLPYLPKVAQDIKTLKESHALHYGKEVQVVATAPVAIHLMGSESWFFKDKMLSLSTSGSVFVGVSLSASQSYGFFYVTSKDEKRCSSRAIRYKKEDKWANQIKAFLKVLQRQHIKVPALDFSIYTNLFFCETIDILPAIRTAVLLALNKLVFNGKYKKKDLCAFVPKMCNDFLAEPYISCYNFVPMFSIKDSIMVTDCSKNIYQNIAFDTAGYCMFLITAKGSKAHTWDANSLMTSQNALLLGDLKEDAKDVFGGWTYKNKTRQLKEMFQMVDSNTYQQLLCIMTEHDCVLQAIKALNTADLPAFMKALNLSSENTFSLYNFVCPEIEWLVKRVLELDEKKDLKKPATCVHLIGEPACKTIFCMLPYDKVAAFSQKLAEYEKIFGSKCCCVQITCSPAAKVFQPATGTACF